MLRIIFATILVLPAFAKTYGGRQNQENNNQNNRQEENRGATNNNNESRTEEDKPTYRERIENGLKTGRLTQAEYDSLMKGQKELKAFRDGIRADGEVTEEEREAMKKLRREQGEKVRDQKHDDQFEPQKWIDSLTQRIVSGVQKGTLSGEEFLKVDGQLQALKAQYAEANSDGVISPEEKESLYPAFDKLQKDIFEEKHDRQNASLNMSNDLYQQISDKINQEYRALSIPAE